MEQPSLIEVAPPPPTRRLRKGATMVEYVLIASLIALAILGSLTYFSDAMITMFNFVETTVDAA